MQKWSGGGGPFWNVYSLGALCQPAGEWNGKEVPGISEWIMLRAQIPVKDYENIAQTFNPVKFDADASGWRNGKECRHENIL